MLKVFHHHFGLKIEKDATALTFDVWVTDSVMLPLLTGRCQIDLLFGLLCCCADSLGCGRHLRIRGRPWISWRISWRNPRPRYTRPISSRSGPVRAFSTGSDSRTSKCCPWHRPPLLQTSPPRYWSHKWRPPLSNLKNSLSNQLSFGWNRLIFRKQNQSTLIKM